MMFSTSNRLILLTFVTLGLGDAFAAQNLDEIEVEAPLSKPSKITPSESSNNIGGDSAALLDMIPGVSIQKGGGLSSLPVIQGMADDRINIKIDGATATSSCPNHMNPAMSYVDPSKITSLEVMAGITPVSAGGDSLAGSIVVRSGELVFAESDKAIKQKLNIRSYFKSNNENQGASFQYAIATEKNYIGYSGFDEHANNYRDGEGKRLKSTLFNQNNQTLNLGRKLDDGVLALKLTRAVVPYEGFINQRMDMVNNVSNLANLNYKGTVGNATVDSTLYYQQTDHEMDMLGSERGGEMPMNTRSLEVGYNLKASFSLSADHLMTVGSDYNRYRLDDWWPGIEDLTVIMGPGDFQSINNGKRDRLGLFVETDSDWSSSFSTNLGIRTDIVSMDTDDVHGYNDTDNLPADAAAFNAKSHKKRDHNYDVTLTSKLKINERSDFEFGLGRKTRSPNLYERYAWAGTVTDPTDPMDMESMSASMDMLMINWFGDGNGYVGNINLKPEVAHKVSASLIAHDEASKEWEMRFTPYFSDIKSFIDADFIGSANGNNFLRFANHDAVIFGADVSGKVKLSSALSLKATGSYTRGYRKDGKADLYHLMPLNGKIAVQYAYGKWVSDLGVTVVDKKSQVNELRTEPVTPGYALLDLGTSFQFSKLARLDLSISNLLDHSYALPLGGIDLVNHSPESRTAVAGMGRSVNMALNLEFF